jgi:hypothetical protein
MEKAVKALQRHYPGLSFLAGEEFCWTPASNEIQYSSSAKGKKAVWALIHETGHALLTHQTYQSDFELLSLEVAAWEKAKAIATQIELVIDEEHIQDCLDTYRDWLHKRCTCPTCHTRSLQIDANHYRCINCGSIWKVSPSRFCRSYRSTKNLSFSLTAN